MAIGPVQLIVLGFPDPDVHGEIIDERERPRQSDTVRVIDALAVYKDAGPAAQRRDVVPSDLSRHRHRLRGRDERRTACSVHAESRGAPRDGRPSE